MARDHFEKHSYQKGKIDWNFNILFDDQPQVAQMAQKYAKLLDHPGLYPPIPPQWLHATVLRIGTTDEYSEVEIMQMADKLESKLASLSLPEFLLGPWWIWSGNPVLHITPEGPLAELFKLTLSMVEEVVGENRTPKYVKAYPGLSRLLSQIGKKHISLAVFTSGTPHHVVRNFGIALEELKQTDLYTNKKLSDIEKLRMFEESMQEYYHIPRITFVTCDDVSANKPDPESILIALDRLGLDKEEVLLLGDHNVDIQAGINAGVPYRIGVSHGFDDQRTLLDAGASQVISSLELLSNLLK